MQDVACNVLPDFLKIYKSDGIDIPMPQKYYIFNSDNTQKLLVNSDNTQKLLVNSDNTQKLLVNSDNTQKLFIN